MSNNSLSRDQVLAEAHTILERSKDRNLSKPENDRLENLLHLAEILDPAAAASRNARMIRQEEELCEAEPWRSQFFAEDYRKRVQSAIIERDFDTLLRYGKAMIPQERRALSVGTGSAGGFLVPQRFSDELFMKMAAYDPLLDPRYVNILDRPDGRPIVVPVVDQTGSSSVIAENNQVTPSDLGGFAQANLTAAPTFRSNMQQVSLELLTDAGFPISSWLAQTFGVMHSRGVGAALSSTLQSAATQGKVGTTGQTTSIIYDDLADLMTSLDPVWLGPKCFWLMALSSWQKILKLKDSQGLPVFGEDAVPDANGNFWLMGKPVLISPSMPAMAANAKSILLGDLSQFFVRRTGVELKIFRELYATSGAVGFQSFVRAGGTLAVSGTVKYYQNSAA